MKKKYNITDEDRRKYDDLTDEEIFYRKKALDSLKPEYDKKQSDPWYNNRSYINDLANDMSGAFLRSDIADIFTNSSTLDDRLKATGSKNAEFLKKVLPKRIVETSQLPNPQRHEDYMNSLNDYGADNFENAKNFIKTADEQSVEDPNSTRYYHHPGNYGDPISGAVGRKFDPYLDGRREYSRYEGTEIKPDSKDIQDLEGKGWEEFPSKIPKNNNPDWFNDDVDKFRIARTIGEANNDKEKKDLYRRFSPDRYYNPEYEGDAVNYLLKPSEAEEKEEAFKDLKKYVFKKGEVDEGYSSYKPKKSSNKK